jgi:hypothetical protein
MKKKNNLTKMFGPGGESSGVIQALNTKLHITNFPVTHTKEMI